MLARFTAQVRHTAGLFVSPLLDLLYPPRCLHCGRIDTRLCSTCQTALLTHPYAQHHAAIPALDGYASSGQHQGILQEAVHTLKYENGVFVAPLLAQRLLNVLASQNWTIDMFIPVPLSSFRLTERGYNQSQMIVEEMGRMSSLPYSPNALRRHRETQTQVGLNAAQRRVNVENAFSANPSLVAGKFIVVVDDVCTTGATLGACASALMEAGAQAVYGLTVTAA